MLSEIDYLLGVQDLHRAGALRFKREVDGPFLDDEEGHLWIAKFPSRQDDYDMAAWEYVAYRLALDARVAFTSSR